jgi:hypothetical protein
MKRMFGWVMAGVGAVGTCYGGYLVLNGAAGARLGPLPVDALTGGLGAVALLTLGLLWVRD